MDVLTKSQQGVLAALLAYLAWALAPIYFHALTWLLPFEVLAHRVVWSFLLLLIIAAFTRRLGDVPRILANKKQVLGLVCSTVLITVNWLLFIWSVQNHHILSASLGYYINPLVSVLLGVLFFSERLSGVRQIAVALCLLAVLWELYHFGRLPIIALVLASSFGVYGLIRKKLGIDSISGLLIETGLLFPVAMLYIALSANDSVRFSGNDWKMNGLMLLAGPITTIPLLLFATAANRISLNALGFFQYIAPTGMFLLAIGFYDEHITLEKMLTFVLIWSAIAVLLAHAGRQYWRQRCPLKSSLKAP